MSLFHTVWKTNISCSHFKTHIIYFHKILLTFRANTMQNTRYLAIIIYNHDACLYMRWHYFVFISQLTVLWFYSPFSRMTNTLNTGLRFLLSWALSDFQICLCLAFSLQWTESILALVDVSNVDEACASLLLVLCIYCNSKGQRSVDKGSR